ncbi:unnamed protein product [Cylicostephanus goldi]|uniref:Uncharacterized protein n=1 Tax=Cylicostephanus goldi TaxID=71465 RepID=A0A3P6SQV5_CYLGO|nr:unnamed protein product [Cylicostephanus goldi]
MSISLANVCPLLKKVATRWLENCHEGVDTLEGKVVARKLFGDRVVAFPFKLLQYVDPLKEEEIARIMVFYALSHHMSFVLRTKDDGEEYVRYLMKIPAKRRDNFAVLHAHSLPGELKRYSGKELSLRLFFHRCVCEHLTSLYKDPEKVAVLYQILRKLLPTFQELVELTESFIADKLKSDEESACDEFSVRQLCLMMRLVDHSSDEAKELWRRLLYQMAANPDVYPSRDLVDFAVREVIEQLDRPTGSYQKTIVWAADTAAKFLQCEVAEENSQREEEQRISALTSTCSIAAATRAATIIHAVLAEGIIDQFPDEYDYLFIIMTGRLSNADSIECRSLCVRMIGLASCLDEHIMKDHVSTVHRFLKDDVCEVKVK